MLISLCTLGVGYAAFLQPHATGRNKQASIHHEGGTSNEGGPIARQECDRIGYLLRLPDSSHCMHAATDVNYVLWRRARRRGRVPQHRRVNRSRGYAVSTYILAGIIECDRASEPKKRMLCRNIRGGAHNRGKALG